MKPAVALIRKSLTCVEVGAAGGRRQRSAPRVLLSYAVAPLAPLLRHVPTNRYSNWGLVRDIWRTLLEMGFAPTAIDLRRTRLARPADYDLIIANGAENSDLVLSLAQTRRLIYLGTGRYWRAGNTSIRGRQAYLERRTGVWVEEPRAMLNEDPLIKTSVGVINLGSPELAAEFEPGTIVHVFPNGAFDRGDPYLDKDYEAARRRFLFFSGPGTLLKGLDLLFEAVLGTDLELVVCHRLDGWFRSVYGEKIRQAGNVRFEGQVRMRSHRFRSLVRQCGWVVSASATDAQPGALIECMAHGLPVVAPREVFLDRSDVDRILPCDSVASVRDALVMASAVSASDLAELSGAAYRAFLRGHQPGHVRAAFRAGLEAILGVTE